MRGLLTSIAFGLICFAVTPALAVSGAYRTLTAQTAASCARACADDGLCIAWSLTDDACALAAVAPTQWPEDATEIGLSSRAPAFASLPARPQALTPIAAASEPQPPATERHGAADYALLGGPDEGDLRLRLGARR